MKYFAHPLTNFCRRICYSRPQIGRQSYVGTETSNIPATGADRYIRAGNCHPRSEHSAIVYGVAKSDINERPVGADVSYGSKSREQSLLCVSGSVECHLSGRLFQWCAWAR